MNTSPDHHLFITRILILLALALLGLAAACFSAAYGRALVDLGMNLLLGAAVIFAFALYFAVRIPDPDAAQTDEDTRPNLKRITRETRHIRRRWHERLRANLRPLPLLISLALLLLLAEENGGALALPFMGRMSHHVQFSLLCAAVVLLVLGLSARAGKLKRPTRLGLRRLAGAVGAYFKTWTTVRWLLIGVFCLAFALRLWDLEYGLHYFVDELNFASAVRHFWLRGDVELFAPFSGSIAFPWLFPYFQMIGVELFGRTLTGLRFPSALIGALQVFALYMLLWELFCARDSLPHPLRPMRAILPLAAALILAVLPVHVHFSRLGLNNIADPLCGMLALAFLARGARTGKAHDFAIAGVSMGFTQYFYEGGRLFYPLLVTLWVGGILLTQLPTIRRRHFHAALVFSFAAGAIALPVYYTLLAQGLGLTVRMGKEALAPSFWAELLGGSWREYLYHLRDALLAFVNVADTSNRHLYYGSTVALIPQGLIPLFVLGIVYALWRVRHAGLLLLLWVMAAVLGNSVLRYSSVSARFVVVFPAIAALIAFGLLMPLRLWFADGVQRRAVVVSSAALLLIVIGCVHNYFAWHLPNYNRAVRLNETWRDGQDAIFRAAALPMGTNVHFVSSVTYNERFAADMMSFLRDGLWVKSLPREAFSEDYVRYLPRDVPHAFLLEPGDFAMRAIIERHFVLEPPQFTPFAIPLEKQYVLYYAPVPQTAVGAVPR